MRITPVRSLEKAAGLAGCLAAGVLICLVGGEASAQLPQTRVYSIFPPGGQRGTKVDLTITSGEDLDELTSLIFSHPGIKAEPKLTMVAGQPPTPIPSQFVVSIDGSVPPGRYDLRASGMFGVSNPRSFTVGDLVEVVETEPNNTPAEAMAVEINSLVNARSNAATDVDHYKIQAKQGQRILAECMAARIDSKMDATLELYSPDGKLVVYNRNGVRRDPLIDFTAPADGEYVLKVYDFLYAGDANQYVYRLKVSTGPFIDFVLPPAGLPNTTGEYTLYGRNLPGGTPSPFQVRGRPLDQLKVSIALPADLGVQLAAENLTAAESSVDGVAYSLTTPAGTSNSVMIYLASAPLVAEVEPNSEPAKSQKIAVPCEVYGQFQARGDVDYLTFDAKAQEAYWVEVYGQRNGTMADPYFTIERVVVDDKGVETVSRITVQDDSTVLLNPQNQFGFDTRNDDAAFRFVVPADGTYRIAVRDRYFESRGEPQLVYRLAIRKERPDFRLVAVPTMPAQQPQQVGTWDLSLRKGDNVPVEILAFRQDGFDGVIDVSVEGLPPGVTASASSLGGTQTVSTLVLSAAEDVAPWVGTIKIVGKARVVDSAKVKAVDEARAAHKAALVALAPIEKKAADSAAAAKVAADKAAAAKTASDAKTDDKALLKAKEDAEAAAKTAGDLAKTAADELAAGQKKVADADAAIKAAEVARESAVQMVSREARGGTIVWAGNNTPSISRVARNITLSVTREAAAIQLVANATRFDVSQNSRVFIPLKMIRRNGFDANVPLTFAGQPQQAQVENKPITKEKNEEVFKVTIPAGTPVGTYTLYLKGQVQVSYSRNPEAAALALKEKEAADKAAVDTAEAFKKATEAKTAAEAKATAAAAEAKKAAEAKVAADKLAVDTAAAAKAAEDEKTKVTGDANAAEDAKTAAVKKAADAAEAAKKAAEAKVAADKAAVDTAALSKTAEEEKTKATADAAAADVTAKSAAALKAVAEKKATDTANVAKPKNVNAFPASTAVVIAVGQNPVTVAVAVPDGGALKKGAQLEAKVTISRVNNFTGPVTLELSAPPAVKGVTAAPVVIPADKTEGVLVIQAAADATEGALADLAVRATAEFNGKAAVDQAVTVKVNP